MAQPSSIARKLSSSHGERRIRVLIEEGKGFAPTAFSEAEVERAVGIGEERSALVLRSGVKIPVALSFEQLEQKIYERDFRTDSSVLDLRDVTGEAAKPKAPANTNQAPAPGDKMPDGTVYAGISPDTGKAMYAAPADDASLTMTFKRPRNTPPRWTPTAIRTGRVPTKNELNVLYSTTALRSADLT